MTISRQSGSRGSYFASRLAQRLGYQRLHRDVIDAICKSSGYRRRVIESLDDHHRSEVSNLVDALLTGQSIDHSDYFRHLVKIILSMARLGGVIVMGRGASFMLSPACGFHIRVVCPREKRIENLMKYTGQDEAAAEKEIMQSDVSRREFIQKQFSSDIDDPLNYDLVLNSALIDVEEMVETTALAVNAKMNKLMFLDHDC